MNRWAYCPTCNKVYETEKIHMKFEYGDGKCPTPGCDGAVFGIDENMIVPIMILNQKGYSTMWSCSGHVYELGEAYVPDGYIAFRDKKCFPDSVPEGWYEDIGAFGYCIRYRNRADTPVHVQHSILYHMATLLDWANDLPDLKKGE